MPTPETVRAATPHGTVAAGDLRRFVTEAAAGAGLDGASVLVVVPDATRTAPLPELFRALHAGLAGRARRIGVLVALGTHRALTDPELDALFGVPEGSWDEHYPGVDRRNHEWWDPATFHALGTLGRDEVRALSGGLLDEDVPVRVNRLAIGHDAVLICGPVFPHEVVGFSGGTKYLFPGISGREMIDASHWLGALIGVREVIGARGLTTPVRALIDRAAALLPTRQLALTFAVADAASVHGAFFGDPRDAWRAAAELSSRVHVTHVERPYRRVLSIVPAMYEDLWTAAKGVYKVDPATADGGEIVVYAPHLTELSTVHGEHIRRVGYHCRDWLVARAAEFPDVPRGVLAHSAHVRGEGTYDAATGEERCRVTVTLASGLSEGECRAVGLGYRDPASIDIGEWAADAGTLVVRKAGERLYRAA